LEKPKIRSICVDTLTAIQNEAYLRNSRKPGHDEWLDYGKDIYVFILDLQARGFEMILILGEPGTGKSSGMRTLTPGTNLWYNADNKNPVWTGGKAEYGSKMAPRAPYHVIPNDYSQVIDHLDKGLSSGMFETNRYAFLTGHIEQYKSGMQTLERLKTLGKLATKMQLEGKLESVFYSRVKKDGAKSTYILETQNNGYNTARSPMDLFEPEIPNDYQMILDKLSSW
jgi:hypothetical protein